MKFKISPGNPNFKSAVGGDNYAIMIPTKGRADRIQKGFKKMPFLNDWRTYVGIEHRERDDYQEFMDENPDCNYVFYHNPMGSVAFARQQLKCHADMNHAHRRLIFTDDNAMFTHESLRMLIRSYNDFKRVNKRSCVMAGAHPTSEHFDRNSRKKIDEHKETKSYAQPAMIFYCVGQRDAWNYVFPHDAYGLDDRHFFLWLMDNGIRDFRVCPDAPYSKSRYQKGGQGTIDERMVKCGRAIEKIARDFSKWAGSTGTLRLPWKLILDSIDGKTPDRLAGGAMRSETELFSIGDTNG
jgi:hypothetical protein|tara:strand:- start:349 stop:1236 length:888 start_codon:yes stop_codon:yes gene_type:complete